MKRIFTLLTVVTLLSISSFARPYNSSKLTIISHHKSEVRITIDGKRYSLDYNSLVLNDIPPGNHTIKIVERLNSTSLSGPFVPSRREKVLYNGSINFRFNYHVDIVINRFGKTLVDEQPLEANRWEEEEDIPYEYAMSDGAFESLRNTLRVERFTSSRMAIAKQVINDNYFKAEQVKQIALMFSFEDDKMQIMKQAYKRTVDRGNYHIMYALLSYSSNKEELARYIADSNKQTQGDDGYSVKPIIGDEDFNKIKSKLAGTFSDNNKISMAKQAIDSYYFTAEQVKELVETFMYEMYRLDLAKYAYGKTVNKINYSIINTLLVSKSSRDDLDRYIANYR
jgi:hypothetical protein